MLDVGKDWETTEYGIKTVEYAEDSTWKSTAHKEEHVAFNRF